MATYRFDDHQMFLLKREARTMGTSVREVLSKAEADYKATAQKKDD